MQFEFNDEKLKETVEKLKVSAALGAVILASKAKERVISIKARLEELADPERAMEALLDEKVRLLMLGGMTGEEAKKHAAKQVKAKISGLGKGEKDETC